MSDKWEFKTFSDCLDRSPKASKIPKRRFQSQGQYPIISQEKDLINGYWNDAGDVVRVDHSVIVFGDHTQVVKIIDFDFVVGADGVKILKPKPFLDPRYFYYFLLGHPVKTLGYARHFRLLKELEVAVPPLSEQKRIVAILDEAFAGIETAIANNRKNLANARELFDSELESIVRSAVGDEGIVTLADLATEITDGDHMPPPKSEEGVPFITIRNIEKATRTIDFSDTFKVPAGYYDSLKPNRQPLNGDVLYTVTGSFGIPVRVDTDRRFCFQRHIGLIRPKAAVSSQWLEYMLLSNFVMDQAEAGATGTAQKTVSLRLLRSLEIPNQKAGQQGVTVARLDVLRKKTQRLQSNYVQKRSGLAELKQSLLQKAFSGELTADRAEREVESAAV